MLRRNIESLQYWWCRPRDSATFVESYVVGNKVARIPLGDVSLELPEGLSEYMDSGLGIAEVFEYSADWTLVGDNLCEIM